MAAWLPDIDSSILLDSLKSLQAVLYSWSFIGVYVFFGSTLFSSPHSTRWSNMVRRH